MACSLYTKKLHTCCLMQWLQARLLRRSACFPALCWINNSERTDRCSRKNLGTNSAKTPVETNMHVCMHIHIRTYSHPTYVLSLKKRQYKAVVTAQSLLFASENCLTHFTHPVFLCMSVSSTLPNANVISGGGRRITHCCRGPTSTTNLPVDTTLTVNMQRIKFCSGKSP